MTAVLLTAAKFGDPTLLQAIPPKVNDIYSSVTAVTSLGDEVFVGRWYSRPNQHVQVYDAETSTLKRQIKLRGLDFCVGLTACDRHRCLYASGIGSSGHGSKIC